MATRKMDRSAGMSPGDLRMQLVESDAACRRLLRELDTKSEELAIMHGLLRAMAGGASIEGILHVLAANLKTLCPYDHLSIALSEGSVGRVRIPYVVRRGRVEINDGAPLVDDAKVAQVMKTSVPMLRNAVSRNAALSQTDTRFGRKEYGSELIIPLQAGERPFGTFNVGCFESGVLTDSHRRALSEIAPCIAIVLMPPGERKGKGR